MYCPGFCLIRIHVPALQRSIFIFMTVNAPLPSSHSDRSIYRSTVRCTFDFNPSLTFRLQSNSVVHLHLSPAKYFLYCFMFYASSSHLRVCSHHHPSPFCSVHILLHIREISDSSYCSSLTLVLFRYFDVSRCVIRCHAYNVASFLPSMIAMHSRMARTGWARKTQFQ